MIDLLLVKVEMAFASQEINEFLNLVIDLTEFKMLSNPRFKLYFKKIEGEKNYMPTQRTMDLLSSPQLNDTKHTAIYVVLRYCNKKYIVLALLKHLEPMVFALVNADYTPAIMGLIIGFKRDENTYIDNDKPESEINTEIYSIDEIVNYARYCPDDILGIPDQYGDTTISLIEDLLKCKNKNNATSN